SFKKTDALAAGIATGIDPDRIQASLGNIAGNLPHLELLFQEASQRPVIQQRGRHLLALATHQALHEVGEPACHAKGIGPIDVADLQVRPQVFQVRHVMAKDAVAAGKPHGVDGTRRGAADHPERVLEVRHQVGQALEHADLIGGSRTAAGEYESGCDGMGHDVSRASFLSGSRGNRLAAADCRGAPTGKCSWFPMVALKSSSAPAPQIQTVQTRTRGSSMPKANELKRGDVVELNGLLLLIKEIEVNNPSARGAATLYKMRFTNVKTKLKADERFKGDEILNTVELTRHPVTFSYIDGDDYI